MAKQVQGHTARRRFGQNFLVSDGVIQSIISAIGARSTDTVVEIGPGLGALTVPLLDRLPHLHVVEIDRDLIARLRQRHAPERLSIHEGDALAFDFGSLKNTGRLKIVGNLPYNISTPLLFHLANYAELVCDMHFMLQREVVERMVATPSDGDFGRLSVMLQYRFAMECLFIVPPGSFDPPPKVDSAIVRLVPLSADQIGGGTPARDFAQFAALVLQAFSQRRKMLRNTLRSLCTETQLIDADIAPTARAEDIGVAHYVRLANSLLPLSPQA
jgi:16S rRNA (adenine1518-N6/adenine1519-N6)-dimethyltransferase